MSATSETPNPYVAPTRTVVAPAPAASVAVYLGGYILIQSLSSQLANALGGYGAGPDVAVLLIGQILFAVIVVVVGLCLAPAPAARKLLASVIVIVGVIVLVVAQVVRIASAAGGIALYVTLANQYFMVALTVGAAWLIVRVAGLGWLTLLLTVVLIPLPYLLATANIATTISQVVLLLVVGVVGAVILLAGRPWLRREAAVAR